MPAAKIGLHTVAFAVPRKFSRRVRAALRVAGADIGSYAAPDKKIRDGAADIPGAAGDECRPARNVKQLIHGNPL
jgi:hypothetical protein